MDEKELSGIEKIAYVLTKSIKPIEINDQPDVHGAGEEDLGTLRNQLFHALDRRFPSNVSRPIEPENLSGENRESYIQKFFRIYNRQKYASQKGYQSLGIEGKLLFDELAKGSEKNIKMRRGDVPRLSSLLESSKDEIELFQKLALMRIRQSWLIDYSDEDVKDLRYEKIAKKPVEQMALGIAKRLYSHFMISAYHRNYGDIYSDKIRYPFGEESPKGKSANWLFPQNFAVNPSMRLAAHKLYSFIEPFKEQIDNVSSRFDLILLLGARVYYDMMQEQKRNEIKNLLNGKNNVWTAFYKTVFIYLSSLEAKNEISK